MEKQSELEEKYRKSIECFNEYIQTDKIIRKTEEKSSLEYGLTVTQFDVLSILSRFGTLSIKELLEKTFSTSGNMTVVIKNLEKAGLVERTLSEKDKRSFLIQNTEKGNALALKIIEDHLKNISSLFDSLSEEETKTFIEILKKIRQTKTSV